MSMPRKQTTEIPKQKLCPSPAMKIVPVLQHRSPGIEAVPLRNSEGNRDRHEVRAVKFSDRLGLSLRQETRMIRFLSRCRLLNNDSSVQNDPAMPYGRSMRGA